MRSGLPAKGMKKRTVYLVCFVFFVLQITKELSICQKLWFYNPYIFATQYRISNFEFVQMKYLRFKYQRFKTLGCKDIGIEYCGKDSNLRLKYQIYTPWGLKKTSGYSKIWVWGTDSIR